VGVDDPAGGSVLVGEFIRTDAQYQELQFQTTPEANDINFENLSSVTIDIYFPSSNDYTGTLTKDVAIGFADKSQTEQWWTGHMEYISPGADFPEDEWVTITHEFSTSPSNATEGGTLYDRTDYDMIFLNIGSGNHTQTGTFYVRNFSIQ